MDFLDLDEQWLKNLLSTRRSTDDVVLDYLVRRVDLVPVAKMFVQEAELKFDFGFFQDLSDVVDLINIKHFLQVISHIIGMDMTRRASARLHFELYKLQFIYLCEDKDFDGVLFFAKPFPTTWDVIPEFRAKCF